MTITEADARRAIALLEGVLEKCSRTGRLTLDQQDEISEFLYDDDGDLRFEDKPEYDGAPMCNCGTCGNAGPFTCVRHD